MSIARRLRPGDKVLVVCPGSSPDLARLYQSMVLLRNWELQVDFDSGSLKSTGFFSNEDKKRLESLWQAMSSSSHQMVWFARGGYGSARLLPAILERLSKLKKPLPPKIYWGLSDVTVLLNLFSKHPKLRGSLVIHGPLLERLAELEVDNQLEVRRALLNQDFEFSFSELEPLNNSAKKAKQIQGKLFGGNLSLLQTSLGTPFRWKAKGHFVFLEEIGERGYRVDRMLVHLRQAGFFTGCLGVFLGDFIGGEEPSLIQGSEGNLVSRALESFSAEVEFPVWRGIESGHGLVQRPLPFGVKLSLARQTHGFLLTEA